MNAARVQIGRVRMKDGGADVRVIQRGPRGPLEQHLRQMVDFTLSQGRPPDAYAFVALWADPGRPGEPAYEANVFSTSAALPGPVVARLATPYLVDDRAATMGKQRALAELGYECVDWAPDDAA